jgi:hypothetical protein
MPIDGSDRWKIPFRLMAKDRNSVNVFFVAPTAPLLLHPSSAYANIDQGKLVRAGASSVFDLNWMMCAPARSSGAIETSSGLIRGPVCLPFLNKENRERYLYLRVKPQINDWPV